MDVVITGDVIEAIRPVGETPAVVQLRQRGTEEGEVPHWFN